MTITLSTDALNYLGLGCGDRFHPRVPDGPRHRDAITELLDHGFIEYAPVAPGARLQCQRVTAAGRAFYEASYDEPVTVPFDGAEHPCICGTGALRVDDGDGFLPAGRVSNDDGEPVSQCPTCDRELAPAPPGMNAGGIG